MLGTRESKIEATHRLQRDGRWNLASLYRDRERLRLKAEGYKRADAREQSWRLMIERFQPLDYVAEHAVCLIQSCPPCLPEGHDESLFRTAWSAVWGLIAVIGLEDAFLRRAVIPNPDTDFLWDLSEMLPAEEQKEIENAFRESRVVLRRLHKTPEKLVEWAEPVLRSALTAIGSGEFADDYGRETAGMLQRLIQSWTVLVDSVEVFGQLVVECPYWDGDIAESGSEAA